MNRPKRGHLYLFVHDGHSVLVVEDNSGAKSLPNYSHWPTVRQKPRNDWSRALLRHVTYGLLDEGDHERIARPPHMATENSLVRVNVSSDLLERTWKQSKRVRLWFRHYGSGHVLWSLRLVPLSADPPFMDPTSMQAWSACLPPTSLTSPDPLVTNVSAHQHPRNSDRPVRDPQPGSASDHPRSVSDDH